MPSALTLSEKLEFLYLSPYYLQSFFFLVGTFSWFISETVFKVRLPFWTQVWGWSLVLTNMLSLPLMNVVGMFLEEAEERDYLGIFSFMSLTYILAPFQAYASLKGFLEKEEGPWFRTPKTGKITDIYRRGHFYRWLSGLLPVGKQATLTQITASYRVGEKDVLFHQYRHNSRHKHWIGNLIFSFLLITTLLLSSLAPFIQVSTSYASQPAFKTVTDSTSSSEPTLTGDQTITNPRIIREQTKTGATIEFVFHREPRVRIKIGDQEIEFETKTIGGLAVEPKKSNMYGGSRVVYEEIVRNVDLVYTVKADQLVEKFILKDREAVNMLGDRIDQSLSTIGINVLSPGEDSDFGLYTKDGRKLVKFDEPYAEDSSGVKNEDFKLMLRHDPSGFTLSKVIGEKARIWLNDDNTPYPVSVDPTVIVSGGIEEAEVQFGGLQKKLVYATNAFYAFYNCDATTCTASTQGKILYKKSTDGGASWSAVVDMDSSDSDNYNPTAWQEGTTLYVAWIDDSADAVEFRTIDTASSDSQSTLCSSADQGSIDTKTFTVSIAVADNGTVYIAYSDTSTDTEAAVFKVTSISSCSGGTNWTNISTPTGITFYMIDWQSAPAADVNPSFNANWEDISIAARFKFFPVKTNTAFQAPKSFSDADNTNKDILFFQFVSDGLARNQTISAQTIRLSMQMYEAAGQDNLFMSWGLYVFSNDGSTLRGTVKAMTARDDTELNAGSDVNRSDTPTSSAVTTSSTEDDRLVLEVGYGGDPTGPNNHNGSVTITDDRTNDLPNDDTTTTFDNPVLVFANAINFADVITPGDRPVLVTIGNKLHMVTQDGKLYHSAYDGSNWISIKATIAANTDTIYDMTTDNSTLWLLTVSGGGATSFYRCSACPAIPSWTAQNRPFAGDNSNNSVALTYDSANNDLYAHAIETTGGEQAYYQSTDVGTISWTSSTSYGFTTGNLGHISAPLSAAGTSQIGVVVRQGTNFEVAILPEKTIYALIMGPFLPGIIKKFRKRR